jgi:hypothetical protein
MIRTKRYTHAGYKNRLLKQIEKDCIFIRGIADRYYYYGRILSSSHLEFLFEDGQSFSKKEYIKAQM